MRFDAWNVSIPVEWMFDVETLLEASLSGSLGPVGRGLHGYRHSRKITVSGATVGVLLFGGNGGRFFVEMKGELSQRWSEIVQNWSIQSDCEVHLTRADICHDWEDDKDVVDLAPGLREHVLAARSSTGGSLVQWSQYGDWCDPVGRLRGCTLYMGASSSAFRVRLYDKGRELMSRGVDASDRLRRVEVQARSSSLEERIMWAKAPPSSFWCASRAVSAVADYFGVSKGEQLLRFRPPPLDLESLFDLISEQYGEPVIQFFHRHLEASKGSSQELLHLVAQDVQARKLRRQRLRRRLAS